MSDETPSTPETSAEAATPISAIRFTSSPLMHAPGFIEFCRQVPGLDTVSTQKAAALWMLAQAYPNAPVGALLVLVEGGHVVDGDAVIVAWPPEDGPTEPLSGDES